MIIPVVLSGGSGTRLWPLSRALRPKQFLALHTEKTLFQDTLLRLNQMGLPQAMAICNNDHRFLLAENARDISYDMSGIILEPSARNTAPAVALAAFKALQDDEDAILLVLPADHVIANVDALKLAVQQAEKLANEGYLVTFGISPTKPHTGYGYIERGTELPETAYEIASFKEKPDAETAKNLIAQGGHYWNSGMFMFKASSYVEALQKYAPQIAENAKKSIDFAYSDLDFIRPQEESFELCENISIDYAVMEKTDKAAVVPLDCDWCDVGSWSALWDIGQKDADGNTLRGDVIAKDTQNSYIYAGNKLVATVGVDNLVVIETKDAVVIADKAKTENIKDIVNVLKQEERSEVLHHRTVYRPWGHYDSIDIGSLDQVKRITVKPHAKLSLQRHFHRSEHWVVVKGTAKVTRGEDVFLLRENESTYIPVQTVHALENPEGTPLEIIEVQTGDYLGEDDIERLEDIYGREAKPKSVAS